MQERGWERGGEQAAGSEPIGDALRGGRGGEQGGGVETVLVNWW